MLLDTFKNNPNFKLLPLVNDVIFKIYFEAEENTEVLKDFLKAHLDDITEDGLVKAKVQKRQKYSFFASFLLLKGAFLNPKNAGGLEE